MPAGVSHYPDPGVEHGAFKVLPRTDGGHVVVDTRRPPGEGTLHHFRGKHSLRDATAAAKTWHEQGHG